MQKHLSPLAALNWLLLIATGVFLFSSIVGCKGSKSSAPKGGGMKFPVEVSVIQNRKVDFTIHAIGSVEAFEIVQVTARVPGVVEKVLFKEGEMTQAGEPLAEINLERYKLARQSAEAQYEKAKATLQEAQLGLTRRLDLQKKDSAYMSSEDMDAWQTKVRTLQADSAQAYVALEQAKLNLRDAYAPAPVSGAIQSRNIRTGQYLQSGATIATLVRRDPLLLRFNVPEKESQKLRKGLPAKFNIRNDNRDYSAIITAVAEFADSLSRMIAVTAEITDNEKNNLKPGTFAEVTVYLGESTELPVVPQSSIRPSERGFLAYVVQDSVAHERVLSIGMQSADGLVEVLKGIQQGDQIVVRGAEALKEGSKVKIVKTSSIGQALAEADTTNRGDGK